MLKSIEHYIAVNNPEATIAFLKKYGVDRPWGANLPLAELNAAHKIREVMKKYMGVAQVDLANIQTPYRDLIISEYQKQQTPKSVSNACGCSHVDGEENCSNCSGKSGVDAKTEKAPVTEPKADKAEWHKYVPAVGITLLVATFIIVATKH